MAMAFSVPNHTNFNPRSLHGERRAADDSDITHQGDFNPRSPHGERRGNGEQKGAGQIFQPTLPARGATISGPTRRADSRFQPTLPARGATLGSAVRRTSPPSNFNPRSPHGERLGVTKNTVRQWEFQPTLPARGATRASSRLRRGLPISTHAPRTGSDAKVPAIRRR